MVSYPMNYEIVLQLLYVYVYTYIYIYMGLSNNDPYFVVVMTVVDST